MLITRFDGFSRDKKKTDEFLMIFQMQIFIKNIHISKYYDLKRI